MIQKLSNAHNGFKEWILETTKEPDDWSGFLSSKLHKQIKIELLSCTHDFEGFVKINNLKIDNAKTVFNFLKKSKLILDYDLGKSQAGNIAVWVKAKHPLICKNILDNKFKLSSDIEVNPGNQYFVFKSFYDDKVTTSHLKQLQNALTQRGITIKELKEKHNVNSIPHEIPKFEFNKDYRKVIELLLESNYFDQERRTMTQEEIAKKAKLSVGKTNKIIRNLQKEGFNTMLSFYPDMSKFESKMKELIKKDKQQLNSMKVTS
ncbi:winged helix-turn-helix domain-containing protein [Nitrosarchaeum koreense]|uniref:Uncharacterized protein n=1 Tax=Nitrosarchaeum koreense MY1 TaxID=1001994 RepID=F9CXU2_9ARCH|nr:winged helix-turn-helix domain-containing protein [Nitrosarchaeum koreense]EGP94058.1 hypothetical protein MY1_1300 [Nitrosarchaeum koreense MY1]